jgi:hypothetical protein
VTPSGCDTEGKWEEHEYVEGCWLSFAANILQIPESSLTTTVLLQSHEPRVRYDYFDCPVPSDPRTSIPSSADHRMLKDAANY